MLRRIEVYDHVWHGPNFTIPWTGMEGLSRCTRQRRLSGAVFGLRKRVGETLEGKYSKGVCGDISVNMCGF